MKLCKDCTKYSECVKANELSKACSEYEERILIKDIECLRCQNVIDCVGKKKGALCVRFVRR